MASALPRPGAPAGTALRMPPWASLDPRVPLPASAKEVPWDVLVPKTGRSVGLVRVLARATAGPAGPRSAAPLDSTAVFHGMERLNSH